MLENLKKLWESTGIAQVFENQEDAWLWGKTLFMYLIVAVLVYLAVKKGFEPLLLLPIAAGMLLANLPGADLFHMELFIDGENPNAALQIQRVIEEGGLLDFLYLGVKLGIYPSLIFLGVGAMTDFSPLNFPLPERTGAEGLDARVTALEETIVRLLEALQYTLTNLGRENFNPAALERLRAELRSEQTTNQ